MGMDNARAGRRARRAGRRACAGRCGDHTEAQIHPGNCYKGLERGGEACLSAGRQSTGGARELGPRSAA